MRWTLRILLIVIACTLVKSQTGNQVKLQINGSQAYATENVAPLKSALLMLDTINFDGKSGLVRLQKGQTTMYLVLSNLDVPCDMKDVYDRKRFLQGNAPRLLPNLPTTAKDEDFVGDGRVSAALRPQKRFQVRR